MYVPPRRPVNTTFVATYACVIETDFQRLVFEEVIELVSLTVTEFLTRYTFPSESELTWPVWVFFQEIVVFEPTVTTDAVGRTKSICTLGVDLIEFKVVAPPRLCLAMK